MTGKDAASYLQRMVSNDVEALDPGEACQALLLTAKARLIAPLTVLRRGDDDYLLLTEPLLGDRVAAELTRFRFAAKCTIEAEEHVSTVVLGGPAPEGAIPTPDYGVAAYELVDAPDAATWRHRLVDALLDAMEHDHPLARRVLSGLEPHVTGRMLDLPALDDLAASLADYLRDEQAAGRIRTDIDPATIARGTVAVIIALTMSMLQFGREGEAIYGDGVRALFDAALEVPAPD